MILGASAKEILNFIANEKIEVVDLRFVDFLGTWHHMSYPASEISEATFEKGEGFDGSSLRGWKTIHESDMLIRPVPKTAFVDPFFAHKTLVMTCDIIDPITKKDFSRDPRFVARKAADYLQNSGIGSTAFFGPEAEFFIFDDVRFDQNEHEGYYSIDAEGGQWNSGAIENPNLAYKPRHKEGYVPTPPADKLQDIRSEMMLTLSKIGIRVEAHHHEVATGGQAEIDMRFNDLLTMADDVLRYKYIVRNVAQKHGKTVTFMPKPMWNDNGSGMHIHLSIWQGAKNLFAGKEYAGLSQMALYAIGGILRHAPALLAFTNPTTNSYKRLVPGFEAPVNLAYSSRNRSAAVRIPMYHTANKDSKRLEFRCPDPTCNPYYAFAALLMAAIDGIETKINPGDPLDKNLYELGNKDLAKVPQTPASLEDSLKALKQDHAFLKRGHVFTQDVIDTWIDYKMENEVNAIRMRPHPWEFALYYDA